ncbi:hypothetical protein Sked_17490 [Sanguibacter keddieii DSM 10542]|uniref:Uncharacterized protein n=1 Tax=Sanguibacter keddieii (strain ATCC 51767 / DSM 10542 / NCFB 3025 / ST-74) TaxID=446469 RepID=D1BGV6_SANKS|nr:hypothetical protein [Sanguibacter keddieii]ACZ21676.1 hypothetical protein Sked_17490 [Sanguibacter keddieii DSM 10542]
MSQPYTSPPPGRWQPAGGPYSLRTPKTSTTGGRVLTLLGVLALVVATVLLIIGIRSIADVVADPLDGGPGSIVIARGEAGQPLELDAEAGRTYSLVSIDRTSGRTMPSSTEVTAPDGSPTRVVPEDDSTDLDLNGASVTRFASFTAGPAGTYTIDVVSSQTRSWDVAVVDPSAVEGLARDIGVGVVLVVAGVLGGLLGLALTVAGAIWWGVRRSNQKKVAASSASGYGYPPPGYRPQGY